VIEFFGFPRRDIAGNKMGGGRTVFTLTQAASVKKRINEYYAGPENKIIYPFNRQKSCFLGVIFQDGWILVTE
jgi:hypothetical protein